MVKLFLPTIADLPSVTLVEGVTDEGDRSRHLDYSASLLTLRDYFNSSMVFCDWMNETN